MKTVDFLNICAPSSLNKWNSYNTCHKSLKQEPFVLNFLQISYVHSWHLCSHSIVPLSFPNVELSVFWSTEMTANPNQHWGVENHTSVSRFMMTIVGPQLCTRIWVHTMNGLLKKLVFDWPIRFKRNSNSLPVICWVCWGSSNLVPRVSHLPAWEQGCGSRRIKNVVIIWQKLLARVILYLGWRPASDTRNKNKRIPM